MFTLFSLYVKLLQQCLRMTASTRKAEKMHNFYSLPYVTRVIKPRNMKCAKLEGDQKYIQKFSRKT